VRSSPSAQRYVNRVDRKTLTDQSLPVDTIGLRASAPTRRRYRSRIDDVALDAFFLEYPVNPEAIQSSFLN
jgi:hypothetical protein